MCVACMEGCLSLAAWLQPWQQLCVLVLKIVVFATVLLTSTHALGFCLL